MKRLLSLLISFLLVLSLAPAALAADEDIVGLWNMESTVMMGGEYALFPRIQ